MLESCLYKFFLLRYVHNGDRFSELRGPKLLAELERKLGVKMGAIVTLRINDEHGAPRKC